MSNVNENKNVDVEIVKHFIKDLSFENPQSIHQNNADNNNNNNITVNMNVIHESYDSDFFSLIIKYTYDCSSKKDNQKLCHLELDYLGFFKILSKSNSDKKFLTEKGLKLIFPFAKEIIEDISQKGGSIAITLNDIDFNLIEN